MNAKGLFKLREHPNLVKCIVAANSLWHDPKGDVEWCPSKPMVYLDGCRIRNPGEEGGMLAHVDSGGIERWWHDEYKQCYKAVWEGKWEELDSYDVSYRTTSSLPTNKFFRAFQVRNSKKTTATVTGLCSLTHAYYITSIHRAGLQ
jgi:hypothetical protein